MMCGLEQLFNGGDARIQHDCKVTHEQHEEHLRLLRAGQVRSMKSTLECLSVPTKPGPTAFLGMLAVSCYEDGDHGCGRAALLTPGHPSCAVCARSGFQLLVVSGGGE